METTKHAEPYLITDSILLTKDTYEYCHECLRKAFRASNCSNRRLKKKLYHQMSQLLLHMLHRTNSVDYSSEESYTRWIPIPLWNSGLKKKYRYITVPSSELGFTRGADLMVEVGMLKKLPHSYDRHRCTQFSLSNEFISGYVKTDCSISSLTTKLMDLTLTERQTPKNLLGILERNAEKGLSKPYHDFRRLGTSGPFGRQDQVVINRYQSALKNIQPLEIDVMKGMETLMTYEKPSTRNEVHHRRDSMAKHYRLMNYLLNVSKDGCLISSRSSDELRIKVNVRYLVTPVGGRLFEIGGGFQTLQGETKTRITPTLTNWNAHNSQLNILKRELEKFSLSLNGFSQIENIDNVKNVLGVPRKVAKTIVYSTLFNGGNVYVTKHSASYLAVRNYFDYEGTRNILKKWKVLEAISKN